MTGLTDDRRIGLEQFYPQLNVLMTGVPKPMMRQALIAALTDFCAQSTYWRELLAELSSIQAQRIYDLDTPTDTRFAGYLTCLMAGEEIGGFSMPSPNTVQFDADQQRPVQLIGAVKPTPNVQRVPESIFASYCEAICHGAVARLLVMPGKPWSDASKVAYHQGEFREGISRAQRDVQQGYLTNATHRRLNRTSRYY